MSPRDYETVYCEALLDLHAEAERRGLTFREAMVQAVLAWIGEPPAPEAAELGARPQPHHQPQPPRTGKRKTGVHNGNAAVLLASLRADGPASNPELVRRTGIPLEQVASAVGQLVRRGTVRATGRTEAAPEGQRGRPYSVWEVKDGAGVERSDGA